MKKALVVLSFSIIMGKINAQLNYRLSATGLQFLLIKDEQGATAKMGQLVSMHMSIQDVNGVFIKNTFQDAKPMLFPVKYSAYEGDIYEAVSLLSKGDSALFLLSADSMYAKVFRKPMPDNLKKGSMLDVKVKVFDVWDQEERIAELKHYADTAVSMTEKSRRAKEDILIQQYIRKIGYEMQKTPLGIYYTYSSKGKGTVESKSGNTIVMNFVGKLLDDTQFETTYNEDNIGRPMSFVLGKGEVISGWDDVMLGKREGDKIICIVPSHLAFGQQQKGSVLPAHSVLIFDIDLMGVR